MLEYHLDALTERDLVEFAYAEMNGHSFYHLTKEGRAYAVENGLLDK